MCTWRRGVSRSLWLKAQRLPTQRGDHPHPPLHALLLPSPLQLSSTSTANSWGATTEQMCLPLLDGQALRPFCPRRTHEVAQLATVAQPATGAQLPSRRSRDASPSGTCIRNHPFDGKKNVALGSPRSCTPSGVEVALTSTKLLFHVSGFPLNETRQSQLDKAQAGVKAPGSGEQEHKMLHVCSKFHQCREQTDFVVNTRSSDSLRSRKREDNKLFGSHWARATSHL